ncbi:MAG: hypothetical protein QOI36_3714 [Pseudonocardiales bacterium]|jgi:DNA-binding GntR family transcriptional regulator|nr:hypothetical protein [Pseudonocardia sp.]MDT7652308.1 hypothetical protein [Pseudonocardiales bacterium]
MATKSLDDLVKQLAMGHKTISEMVYEVLRVAIVSGTFAPGEQLRQEALADAIGVSRIPVRSALIQLESEGLVTFRPRRGAVVRSLSVAQVREIYDLRMLLEPHGLRSSMASMTELRLQRLRAMAEQLDSSAIGSEFVDLRVEFYRELYDAESNPTLVKIVEELRASVGRYLLGQRVPGTHRHSHVHLVGEVATGDPERAVVALTAHLGAVRSGVEAMLTQSEETAAACAPNTSTSTATAPGSARSGARLTRPPDGSAPSSRAPAGSA